MPRSWCSTPAASYTTATKAVTAGVMVRMFLVRDETKTATQVPAVALKRPEIVDGEIQGAVSGWWSAMTKAVIKARASRTRGGEGSWCAAAFRGCLRCHGRRPTEANAQPGDASASAR